MKFAFSSAIVLVLFATACSYSPSAHEQSIRAARQNSNEGILQHDTAVIARSLAGNVHVVTSRNFEASGKRAHLEMLAKEFATKKDVVYTRTPEAIKIFTDWNTASEQGTWVGEWVDGSDRIKVKGNYFAKWVQVDGRWLIRAEVFVASECKGGGYCVANSLML